MRKILLFAFCALALAACKRQTPTGTGFPKDTFVTGDVFELTFSSVKLTAQFNQPTYAKVDHMDLLCSKDPEPDRSNCVGWWNSSVDPETQTYTYEFRNLEPGTKYYYRTFVDYISVFDYGSIVYGEVKSFTTPAVSYPTDAFVTGDAVDLTSLSVKLTAFFNPPTTLSIEKMDLLCSVNPEPDCDNSLAYRSSNFDSETQTYTCEFGNLEPGTKYYYRTYVDYSGYFDDGKTVFGEVKSFTTPDLVDAVITEQPFAGTSLVLLRGKVSLNLEDLKGRDCQVWFLYGEKGNLGEDKIDDFMEDDGTFDIIYVGGAIGTVDCFRAGITIDGKDYPGEIVDVNYKKFIPTEGDLIDMGLSVKWGAYNVGADKTNIDGPYFAWGETTTKETFTPENYTYKLTPSQLPLADDAAAVNLGAPWRMPTKEEFRELLDGSNVITEDGVFSGRYGAMIMSRKNGNRLFFPAAGSDFNDGSNLRGTSGTYWSSSYSEGQVGAYRMSLFGGLDASRPNYGGCSVRGVCE